MYPYNTAASASLIPAGAAAGAATCRGLTSSRSEAMPQKRSSKSAAEAKSDRESRSAWDNEGGSVDARVPITTRYADRVISGRIVHRGRPDSHYMVELTHEDGHKSEHPFATMREGEAFIKSAAPTPPRRDTSRDHPNGQS